MRDDLLDNMTGNWRILRKFPNRTAENNAKIEWVLSHRWLRIEMTDAATPATYGAHVYITRMESDGTYTIHWLDTFGGSVPDILGIGIRSGNSIVFSFKDGDTELRNTFTWNADEGSWTSRIEQTGADRVWKEFCTDTYTPARPEVVQSSH